MTRYFFHVADLGHTVVDEEGLELPDDDSAILEARRAAVDLLRDAVLSGDDILHQVIEIRTDQRAVAVLSLASVAIPLQ